MSETWTIHLEHLQRLEEGNNEVRFYTQFPYSVPEGMSGGDVDELLTHAGFKRMGNQWNEQGQPLNPGDI